jgi:hypothetical protein
MQPKFEGSKKGVKKFYAVFDLFNEHEPSEFNFNFVKGNIKKKICH